MALSSIFQLYRSSQFYLLIKLENSKTTTTYHIPWNKTHTLHYTGELPTYHTPWRGRRGRDRIVVGFTTTYAISAYQHWCGFESRSGRGVQHYVIKFVSDLRQVRGFLRVLRFPPPIKLTATT